MTDTATINLPSRFDYSYHKVFSESYNALLAEDAVRQIIIDFSRVEYIDSSGLGMLVMLQKKAAAKSKQVKIKGAKGSTGEILTIANMQKLFEFI